MMMGEGEVVRSVVARDVAVVRGPVGNDAVAGYHALMGDGAEGLMAFDAGGELGQLGPYRFGWGRTVAWA